MKHQKISEKYQKWIIEFYSDKYVKSVFLIWLTDTSDKKEKDQILLVKSDKLFAAKSKRKLIKKVSESQLNLPDSKKTKEWLKKSLRCNKLSSTKYDLRKIETKILSNELKEKDIEQIIDFINLYEDYKIQMGEQKSKTKRLNKIWNYYYKQIFFPNFNRTNQKRYVPSKLKINNKKLFKEFSEILKEFESKIELKKGKTPVENNV